jgi:hypothetical protein
MSKRVVDLPPALAHVCSPEMTEGTFSAEFIGLNLGIQQGIKVDVEPLQSYHDRKLTAGFKKEAGNAERKPALSA